MKSSQFVAMAFICNGFGNLDGNEWENTGGDDGCESDGGNEEGNDEGGNYNGCTFNLGIGGDGGTAIVLRGTTATASTVEGVSQKAAQGLSL